MPQRHAPDDGGWNVGGHGSILDAFGRNERSGLGGRAAVVDSVTRSNERARFGHIAPSHSPGAEHPESRPGPSAWHDAPGPGPFNPDMFGDNSLQRHGGASHGAGPAVQHSLEVTPEPQSRFPPLSRAPLAPAHPTGRGVSWAESPPQHPLEHPLEYDGGDEVGPYDGIGDGTGGWNGERALSPASQAAALDEYYERTGGRPAGFGLGDGDRDNIESLFETDDFQAQFNRAAAAGRQQPSRAPELPPIAVGSPARPRAVVNGAVDDAPAFVPLCHACHAGLFAPSAPPPKPQVQRAPRVVSEARPAKVRRAPNKEKGPGGFGSAVPRFK